MITTIKSGVIMNHDQALPPLHPGEVLREEFLVPMGLSSYAVAKALGIPPQRVADIAGERRGISADTAARLGRFFFGDAHAGAAFWLNLQSRFDLETALLTAGPGIDAIEPYPSSAK